MKPIVIIPARGGSKRIPRKNISDINGQSALDILILKLQNMDLFEKIVVSTDDAEISKIARRAGAAVVNRTSLKLSDDITPTEEVVRDFITSNNLQNSESSILCIYPLALLLTKFEISAALKILSDSPDMFIISAGEMPINPLRHSFTMKNDNVSLLFPENNDKRSQDLEKTYFDVGMFYLAYPKIWMDKEKYWYTNNSKIVLIPRENCIDVDTEEDLINLKIQYAKTHSV
jgi:pseudaminic acid cytidylyltransferase